VIVVDASVGLDALLFDGPARRLLGVEDIHVPHLIDSEIANVLRRRTHARVLNADQGKRVLDAWRKLALIRHAVHPLLGRIWELRDNLSAYDASYVALAETVGCPLVTADGRLSRAAGIGCLVTVVPR
jgi:predicted nucleic acid-binding protein